MEWDANQLLTKNWLDPKITIKLCVASLLWEATRTVAPRFNEPLCNNVLGLTNDIPRPSNSKIYGKEPRYNETSFKWTYFASPLAHRYIEVPLDKHNIILNSNLRIARTLGRRHLVPVIARVRNSGVRENFYFKRYLQKGVTCVFIFINSSAFFRPVVARKERQNFIYKPEQNLTEQKLGILCVQ